MGRPDTEASRPQLIFVYNADSGPFAAIMDGAHKLFAPNTYQCSLCAITHGTFNMRPEWKGYIRSLPYEIRFYHRDGFRREWPELAVDLPAIFLQRRSDRPRLLVDAAKLAKQQSIAQLAAMLGGALAEEGQQSRFNAA